MKIHKGDQVLIIKGKDRGKKGKVLRGFPKENKVLVEGVNIRKRHRRPKKEGEKGQIVELPSPLHVSKIKIICSKCGKPVKIGYKKEPRVRICKKCQAVL